MTAVSADRSLSKPQFLAWLTAFVGWLFDYYEIALMTFLVVAITAEFDLSPRQGALLLALNGELALVESMTSGMVLHEPLLG